MNNRINLNPKIWGDKGWFFLDSIVQTYPEIPTYEQKQEFKSFFRLVGHVLPCFKCRVNYSDHLTAFPLTDIILSSRNNMISWWLDIHNSARKTMNIKPFTPKQFEDYYYSKYVKNDDTTNTRIVILVCLIIIGLLLYYKFSFRQ